MGYRVVNFEVASFNSFQDIPKKYHFVTATAAEAAADIDDSIKRKCFRVSHNNIEAVSNVVLRP